MRYWGIVLGLAVIASAVAVPCLASPFVVFPKAGELVSPDGRFVVRSMGREGAATEFVGTFNTLWLTETATGQSRKLCDYLGVAAVAFASNDFIIVTQYSKRTSQSFVFSAERAADPVVLDKSGLTRLVAVEMRDSLRQNDHVFVEASRVVGDTLFLSVWGYGQHDANGFRWSCEYALKEDTASCHANSPSH